MKRRSGLIVLALGVVALRGVAPTRVLHVSHAKAAGVPADDAGDDDGDDDDVSGDTE
jgi:hypothetical protein